MPSERPDLVLTVLGSGTLLPDAERASAAHHVQVGSASILMDCGTGTVQGLARHGLDWTSLTHVAITHDHPDHVGDLSALMFALRWEGREAGDGAPRPPLTLLGPRGFRHWLATAADALGPHLQDPKRPLRVKEVLPGLGFVDEGHGIRLDAVPTPHTDESVAYRLESSEGIVGYTGDTGPSEALGGFLSGSDVLVSECAWSESGQGPGHLAPEDVAALAAVVSPEVLVLTHVYPPMTGAEAVSRVRRRYGGSVVAGRDGLRISRGASGWTVDPAAGDV